MKDETTKYDIPKIKDGKKLDKPEYPVNDIGAHMAQLGKDPNCKTCHGKGYVGFLLKTHQIMYCHCAYFSGDGFAYVMKHVEKIEDAVNYLIGVVDQIKILEIENGVKLDILNAARTTERIKKFLSRFKRDKNKIVIKGNVKAGGISSPSPAGTDKKS